MKRILYFCILAVLFSIKGYGQGISHVDIMPSLATGGSDFYFVDSMKGYFYDSDKVWATTTGGLGAWFFAPSYVDSATGAMGVTDNGNWIAMGGYNQMGMTESNFSSGYSSLPLSSVDPGPVVWLQFFDSANGYAAMAPSLSGDICHLYKTSNQGFTWGRLAGEFSWQMREGSLDFGDEVIHFLDMNHGFAMVAGPNSSHQLVRTSDGGLNWDTLVMASYASFQFLDNNVGFWGMDYMTTDGGQNWMSTGNMGSQEAVGWLNQSTGLVVDGCQMLSPNVWESSWSKTTDGGATRSSLNFNSTCFGKVQAISSTLAFAGGKDPVTGNYSLVRVEDGFTTGLEEEMSEGVLKIYPNPAVDHVTVEVSSRDYKTLSLIDGLGRVVLKSTFRENEKELSLAHLPLGLYILKMRSKEANFSRQLLIVK